MVTPTRKQKKTWRRRVSRARWSRNQLREVAWGRDIFDDNPRYAGRVVLAPWRRTEHERDTKGCQWV